MNSIMQSIKPRYCFYIMIGKKLIEVRKTIPKFKPPFKVYIYCTIGQKLNNGFGGVSEALKQPLWKLRNGTVVNHLDVNTMDCFQSKLLNGKVIGEYICDKIYQYTTCDCKNGVDIDDETMVKLSCLTKDEIHDYETSVGMFGVFGYHITNLKIYDEPKSLSEFTVSCPEYEKLKFTAKCRKCEHYFRNDADMCYQCDCEGEKRLARPFQSWGYVDDLDVGVAV